MCSPTSPGIPIRVILEYEVEDLTGFAAQLSNYATNESLRAAMKGYTDLWMAQGKFSPANRGLQVMPGR